MDERMRRGREEYIRESGCGWMTEKKKHKIMRSFVQRTQSAWKNKKGHNIKHFSSQAHTI